MLKVHLDTDIGGDIDDLCALALLLKLPEVDLVGVTTVAEEAGRRAGYVRDGWVVERPDPDGKPFRVVTRVDGPAFSEAWVGWVAG